MTMLDDLVTLICKLRLHQPQPLAIWFVDRDAEYYRIVAEADKDLLEPLSYPLRLYGIPFKQFTTYAATVSELAFCHVPGIWIEMSDGNHVRLEEPGDRLWVRELCNKLLNIDSKEERRRILAYIMFNVLLDLSFIEGVEESPLGIVGETK